MTESEIVKRLEYCINNQCDICQEENGSGFPWVDGRCYGFTERVCDALALLKAQEPIEARLNLCDSCAKLYPECDATADAIKFGCGVGNDNVIGCMAYVNRWKAQQPRVMTLEELDDLRGRGRAVYYEDRDAVAKCQDMFYLAVIGEYVYLKGETYVLPKRVDQYGKTWRHWTSRPTDEQREATPWDVGTVTG